VGKFSVARFTLSGFLVLILVCSGVLLKPEFADAELSQRHYVITLVGIDTYHVRSAVRGWDSSAYPGKIHVERYSLSISIPYWHNKPLHQRGTVFLREGKFREDRRVLLEFWHGDLRREAAIQHPDHWYSGGWMPVRMYMSKGAVNDVRIQTVYNRRDLFVPRWNTRTHTFH
jgi:hypothetical protein